MFSHAANEHKATRSYMPPPHLYGGTHLCSQAKKDKMERATLFRLQNGHKMIWQ